MSLDAWWTRLQQTSTLNALLIDSGDMTPEAARRVYMLVMAWAGGEEKGS